MFRTGARGARVSPDPWGSYYEEEQNTDIIDDDVGRVSPPSFIAPPPKETYVPPKEPKPKQPDQTANKQINEKAKNDRNQMNGGLKSKEPKKEFVYHGRSKKNMNNDQLDKYLHARFSSATRAWTPHLGVRYR